jgi:hypothetical protein
VNLAAAEFAWIVVGLIIACALICWGVVHAITRWLDAHRWEQSTRDINPDWSDVLDVIDEAEDATRRAASGESWWL